MIFKNIALVSKSMSEDLIKHLIELGRYLESSNINVFIDNKGFKENALNGFKLCDITEHLDKLDLVIAIGGDGTLLATARRIVDREIPIIGVNQGKLGFMTDITLEEIDVVISEILLGVYDIETRTLLNAQVLRNGNTVYSGIALNDIVISRGAVGSMIEFDISINEQFVLSQKSDGVIFSTPTGSTAYSIAAGGAIINPDSKVFSIVSICPQSLSNRPIIISDNDNINFLLSRDNATHIHYDGQDFFNLQLNDIVKIVKHGKELKMLHPKSYNYYRTLRKKLNWSKRVS